MRCPFCHNGSLVRSPMESQNQCNEVLDYLSSRQGVLEGVCITGGEPLLQPDLAEFIKKVKSFGFKVKLDTNGSMPKRLQEILETGLLDYVAMDIKSSLQNYQKACGTEIDTQKILKSIELLNQSGIDHEFRTTAVKGIHQKSDFEEIAKLLKPDNKYFIQCFTDSGNLLEGGEAFTPQQMQEILNAVKTILPKAELRGQK